MPRPRVSEDRTLSCAVGAVLQGRGYILKNKIYFYPWPNSGTTEKEYHNSELSF